MGLVNETYKNRIVDKKISELMRSFGAVCVEGPKWCGKYGCTQCLCLKWANRQVLIDNQPAFNPALRSSRRALKSPKRHFVDP